MTSSSLQYSWYSQSKFCRNTRSTIWIILYSAESSKTAQGATITYIDKYWYMFHFFFKSSGAKSNDYINYFRTIIVIVFNEILSFHNERLFSSGFTSCNFHSVLYFTILWSNYSSTCSETLRVEFENCDSCLSNLIYFHVLL